MIDGFEENKALFRIVLVHWTKCDTGSVGAFRRDVTNKLERQMKHLSFSFPLS